MEFILDVVFMLFLIPIMAISFFLLASLTVYLINAVLQHFFGDD